MRGISKREDSAFWVIRIDEVKGRPSDEKGARFHSTFTKQRNNESPEWTREWTFHTEANGQTSMGCAELSFDGKVLQLIKELTGSETREREPIVDLAEVVYRVIVDISPDRSVYFVFDAAGLTRTANLATDGEWHLGSSAAKQGFSTRQRSRV